MAITALSAVCGGSGYGNLMSPEGESKIVWGKLAADCSPGDVVTYTTSGWAKCNSGTAAHKLQNLGIVLFRSYYELTEKRYTDIDDDYDVDDGGQSAPILVRGAAWGRVTDQGATVPAGTFLMASSTAGSATIAATPGDSNIVTPLTVGRDIADDDTLGILCVGGYVRYNEDNIQSD
jgi:hypothetical protein